MSRPFAKGGVQRREPTIERPWTIRYVSRLIPGKVVYSPCSQGWRFRALNGWTKLASHLV